MSNAVASVVLSAQSFPLPTVAGPVVITLLDASGATVASQSVTQTAADLNSTATFSNVAPGTYTVSAVRQDGAGNALAPAVTSDPFTVAASTTTITVPVNVTVTVQ